MCAKVKVVEQYHNYAPPVDVNRSLEVLLRYVPQEHLIGLHQIVLTNSESLRGMVRGTLTQDKRRIRRSECQGLYGKGRILLIVDRIFQNIPEIFLLVLPFKTFLIGEVLYHEIGHHIHRLEEPGYRHNKEAVADEWKEKLLEIFLKQRYWYLAGAIRLFSPLLRPIVSRFECSLAEEEARRPAEQAPAADSSVSKLY